MVDTGFIYAKGGQIRRTLLCEDVVRQCGMYNQLESKISNLRILSIVPRKRTAANKCENATIHEIAQERALLKSKTQKNKKQ